MKYLPTPIDGAFVIELDKLGDDRGFFARTFDAEEFAAHGLTPAVEQCNFSHSAQAGTLRGMHYQAAPHGEAKLIRCVRGSIFDAIYDMRTDSNTYGQSFGVELTHENYLALFAPAGTAHGFLTLEDDTDVSYQVSARYTPGAEGGLRWNDPALNITWPREPTVMSDKDAAWPLLQK